MTTTMALLSSDLEGIDEEQAEVLGLFQDFSSVRVG